MNLDVAKGPETGIRVNDTLYKSPNMRYDIYTSDNCDTLYKCQSSF